MMVDMFFFFNVAIASNTPQVTKISIDEKELQYAQNYYWFAMEDYGDMQILHDAKKHLTQAIGINGFMDCEDKKWKNAVEQSDIAWTIHKMRPYYDSNEKNIKWFRKMKCVYLFLT